MERKGDSWWQKRLARTPPPQLTLPQMRLKWWGTRRSYSTAKAREPTLGPPYVYTTSCAWGWARLRRCAASVASAPPRLHGLGWVGLG